MIHQLCNLPVTLQRSYVTEFLSRFGEPSADEPVAKVLQANLSTVLCGVLEISASTSLLEIAQDRGRHVNI
jgi:hypothetical protein